MADNRKIGILLIVVAIGLVLFLTPSGKAFIEDIKDGLFTEGNTVVCNANVDKDSVHEAHCTATDTCSSFASFAPLGFWDAFFTSELELKIIGLNKVYSTVDLELDDFGTNKFVSINACIPTDVRTGRITISSKGAVRDEIVVTW